MDRSEELRRYFRRQLDTYRSGDIARYLNGYAPDATIFAADSLMNLDQMRTFMASAFDGGAKSLDLRVPDLKDIRFSESGDAATASFRWREHFRHADGHETDSEYQETDVWFRRSGEWRLVHLHLSTISERTIRPVKHQ